MRVFSKMWRDEIFIDDGPREGTVHIRTECGQGDLSALATLDQDELKELIKKLEVFVIE